MSTDQFLTKDERDALMEVVSKKSRSRSISSGVFKDEAQSYDLASQDYAINNLLPVLETIHERFAHRLRISLFDLLRRDLMVTVGAIEKRSYTDLTTSLSVPCSVNVIDMAPLSGPALLIFDQELIFMIVDTFFGGTGRLYKSPSARAFTTTETRFIQRLIELSFRCLEEAWEPFATLKCTREGSESKPQFITALNPTETLAVSSVHVGRDNIAGILHLALPYSILEPIRKTLLNSLHKEHPNPNPQLTERLQEGIQDSQVETHCCLAGFELSLNELLELKVGDVIPVDIPNIATLQVENVPVYRGSYGVAQGWRALRIEQALGRPGQLAAHSAPSTDFSPFEVKN
ncbi:MAG: flagellar motor switch protein FliM [Candidatus Competibacteraceae bacterium]|nr:flagellar motor switch protein FliM [Candidatus Competibacteraceae bacterium]MCP5125015.1 flagellar motor switch protein FliM [Gammaproteobacteria bacterium]